MACHVKCADAALRTQANVPLLQLLVAGALALSMASPSSAGSSTGSSFPLRPSSEVQTCCRARLVTPFFFVITVDDYIHGYANMRCAASNSKPLLVAKHALHVLQGRASRMRLSLGRAWRLHARGAIMTNGASAIPSWMRQRRCAKRPVR
jgi:hypothetical protein